MVSNDTKLVKVLLVFITEEGDSGAYYFFLLNGNGCLAHSNIS